MKVVVDTSSFFSGFLPDGSNEYLTTESVLQEIRGRGMKKSIELRMNFLSVARPRKEYREKVLKDASKTGEERILSSTDIDVLALALENDALVLTNDLAMQNVCNLLGLRYDSFRGKEISYVIKWAYKCEGCGRRFSSYLESCPYCGNKLRRYPRKKKII